MCCWLSQAKDPTCSFLDSDSVIVSADLRPPLCFSGLPVSSSSTTTVFHRSPVRRRQPGRAFQIASRDCCGSHHSLNGTPRLDILEAKCKQGRNRNKAHRYTGAETHMVCRPAEPSTVEALPCPHAPWSTGVFVGGVEHAHLLLHLTFSRLSRRFPIRSPTSSLHHRQHFASHSCCHPRHATRLSLSHAMMRSESIVSPPGDTEGAAGPSKRRKVPVSKPNKPESYPRVFTAM